MTSPSKRKEDFVRIGVIGRQDGPKDLKLTIAIARACHMRILEEKTETESK